MRLKILLLSFIIFYACSFTYSQTVKSLTGHQGTVNSITFFPDGKSFASGGSDDDLLIWNYNTFEKSFSIESDLSDIIDIKILKDGNYIVSTNKQPKIHSYRDNVPSAKDRTIGVWDVKNKKQTYPFEMYRDLSNIDVSPSGDKFVCAFEKRSTNYYFNKCEINGEVVIYVYNINNYDREEYNIKYSEYSFDIKNIGPNDKNSISFYPIFAKFLNNEDVIVAGMSKNILMGTENEIAIINLSNKSIKKKLSDKITELNVNCIELSPNKKLLAVANYGKDSWIYIWDLDIGKSYRTLKGHEKNVLSLAFSPDGNYLASGSKDNTIILWDIKTGKKIKVLKDHEDNVNSICFSPDGKNLLSGSDDNSIKVWNVSDILPELKIYSIKYDLYIGLKSKLQDEYKKEFEETVANFFKPKGEFETTDEYNKRIETGKDLQKQLDEKYKNKLEESTTSKESELQSEKQQKQELEQKMSAEIQVKIDKSTKDTIVNITNISAYNADNQIFTIKTKGYNIDVIVPITDAPSFKENWQKATVKCKKQLMTDLKSWKYFDFVVVHPISKNEYPAVKKE